MDEELPIAVGQVIDGKYQVEAIIARGGMGLVVRAHHQITLHRVAIKILLPQAAMNVELIERFRLEASAANRIGHEGFVRPIDFGDFQGKPYLVMEFLSGVTLGEEVRRAGAMPLSRAAFILCQIADALAAAHAAGIIHRDLKPDNIFVCAGDEVKILDLGIAKFVENAGAPRTRTNAIIGTPHTMSPEQCRGSPLDHRTDIYSLAVVGFFLCAGRFPFVSDFEGDLVAAHLRDPPPRLDSLVPEIPSAFSDILYRAMDKRPSARQQTMAELAAEVRPFGRPDPAAPLHVIAELSGRSPLPAARNLPPPGAVDSGPTQVLPAVTQPRVAEAALTQRTPQPAVTQRTPQPAVLTPSVHGEAAARPPEAKRWPRVAAVLTGVAAVWLATYWILAARPRVPATTANAPVARVATSARTPEPPRAVARPAATAQPLLTARSSPAPRSVRTILDVEPAGSSLSVDGIAQAGPPFALTGPPGRSLHILVEHAGYRPVDRAVTLDPKQARLAVQLDPIPPPAAPKKGRLEIYVNPAATAFVDGRRIGKTPFRGLSLPAGAHKIELVNQERGFPAAHPFTKRVSIRPGKTEVIDLDWSQ